MNKVPSIDRSIAIVKTKSLPAAFLDYIKIESATHPHYRIYSLKQRPTEYTKPFILPDIGVFHRCPSRLCTNLLIQYGAHMRAITPTSPHRTCHDGIRRACASLLHYYVVYIER